MEEFHQARTNKRCERNLHVRIKEIHTYMRETEVKEEEELKQHKESLKKERGRIEYMEGIIGEAQKETCYIILLHTVGSTLCVVISINICYIPIYFLYHILNFYIIIFLNSLSTK
jgi:hypothetical protein